MILSLTTDGAQGYAFSPPDPKALNMASKTEARQTAVKASLAALASQSPSAKPNRANAFLGNLSSYAPIYAVYGPGTRSDGRVQISLNFTVFGNPEAVVVDTLILTDIHTYESLRVGKQRFRKLRP